MEKNTFRDIDIDFESLEPLEAVKPAKEEAVIEDAALQEPVDAADDHSIHEAIKELRQRLGDEDLVEVVEPAAPETVEVRNTDKKAEPEEKRAEDTKAASPEVIPMEKENSDEAEQEISETSKTDTQEENALSEQTSDTSDLSKIEEPEKIAGRPNYLKFGLEPVLPYSMEEAVNRLRINISFLGGDVKKIMVVSSEPNEGKSFVALNLWKQMAVSGERSILVDLDMRKSTMLVKYQLEREDGKELRGTSHFLSGNDNIEDMILHTNLEFGDILPNVDNIVNPSMLLESRKFSEMMRYMEEHYRYVFVDVPPLGLVSDGELIGNACDGALLCVRGGVTSRTIVRRSIQQIERAGCQLLGIVLNRVGGSGSGYYHKYYGKKYYYNDKYYSEG